jgi:hypothetical protein
MSVVISGTVYPFFFTLSAFLAAVAFAGETATDSTATLLVAALCGRAIDGAAAALELELLELELAGVGGGLGAGAAVLELELPELLGCGAFAAAAVFRFGIDPKVNESVDRCSAGGSDWGEKNVMLAAAGVVAVEPCTLSNDFTCTFILVTVVWVPPALCAAC